MEEILKAKKLRITDFRVSVLEIFNKYTNAISVQQIENELKNFDRITLYRTLKTFKERGVIHEIAMPGDLKKLALCATGCAGDHHEHKHIHFHCNNCGEVYCLEVDHLPEIGLKGFAIDSLEIQANGICENCQRA